MIDREVAEVLWILAVKAQTRQGRAGCVESKEVVDGKKTRRLQVKA